MNKQQLQSQIALNRNIINALHNDQFVSHLWLRMAIKDSDEEYVARLKKIIHKDAKSIAQYVVLQKTLKKQLAEVIYDETCGVFVEQKQYQAGLKSMKKLTEGYLVC